MKTKTIIELLTLSASIYHLAKDTHLIDHINELSSKGVDGINKAAAESELDIDGNELEFMDKILKKAGEVKGEIEERLEELVIDFYKKINVVHTDEIAGLQEKIAEADKAIALLEARLNHLEAK